VDLVGRRPTLAATSKLCDLIALQPDLARPKRSANRARALFAVADLIRHAEAADTTSSLSQQGPEI
jgi:hypothetical protein